MLQITTVAGNSGGVPVPLAGPEGITTDAAGNIYVAGTLNHVIRRITPAGVATIVAGIEDTPGHVDGPVATALLETPLLVRVDPAGNIFTAEVLSGFIRKITPAGMVSTVMSGATIEIDLDGALLVFGTGNGIARVAPDGTITNLHQGIDLPRGYPTIDDDGNLYFSFVPIRQLAPDGTVTVVAGSATQSGVVDGPGTLAHFDGSRSLAAHPDGSLYVVDTTVGTTIRKISPAWVVTTVAGNQEEQGTVDGVGAAARFTFALDIAIDDAGTIYIIDNASGNVRKGVRVQSAGPPAPPANDAFANATILGGFPVKVTAQNVGASRQNNEPRHDGEPGGASVWWRWTAPRNALATVDTLGSDFDTVVAVYTGNSVGGLTPIASDHDSGTGGASALLFPAFAGTTYYITVDGVGGATGRIELRLELPERQFTWGTNGSGFNRPTGITAETGFSSVVADKRNHVIRRVSPGGATTILAGTPGQAGFRDATMMDARFRYPGGVARDDAGNIYVADTGNHVIRRITPAGVVRTIAGYPGLPGSNDGFRFAARFNRPFNLEIGPDGALYVADHGNATIRRVALNGQVTTLAGRAGHIGYAGGVGRKARFMAPADVAAHPDGSLIVADAGANTIRRVTLAGEVTSLAGAHSQAGPGAPLQQRFLDEVGRAARFHAPHGVAVDEFGNILVADTNNHSIRRISPAGVVTTVGGSEDAQGEPVPGASGGIGRESRFRFPQDLAFGISPIRRLFVADSQNNRIMHADQLLMPPPPLP